MLFKQFRDAVPTGNVSSRQDRFNRKFFMQHEGKKNVNESVDFSTNLMTATIEDPQVTRFTQKYLREY